MEVTGVWRDGKVELDSSPPWPEGARLRIEADDESDLLGDDPETIKRWLAEFDSIPPLQMSPEEEAEWNAHREEIKQYTIKKMLERDERWPSSDSS